MSRFDTQEEREPVSEAGGPDQPTETRADVLVMAIIATAFGGFIGGLLAWGVDVSLSGKSLPWFWGRLF